MFAVTDNFDADDMFDLDALIERTEEYRPSRIDREFILFTGGDAIDRMKAIAARGRAVSCGAK